MFVDGANSPARLRAAVAAKYLSRKYWPENVYIQAHRRCNYRRINARFTRARRRFERRIASRGRDARKLYFYRVIGVHACHLSSVLYILKYLHDRARICLLSASAKCIESGECCPAALYRMSQMCVMASVTYAAQNTFVSTYNDAMYLSIARAI